MAPGSGTVRVARIGVADLSRATVWGRFEHEDNVYNRASHGTDMILRIRSIDHADGLPITLQ